MDESTLLAWLALTHSPLSPAALRRLVRRCPDPHEIMDLPDRDWRAAGADDDAIRARRAGLRDATLRKTALRAVKAMERVNASLVPLGSADYPPLLAEIHDPPPVLYVAGRRSVLRRRQFAVVGSRRCSSGGRRAATQFARGLVQAGFSVASGLALGVDGAAHRAAVDAGGETVAVTATGIDSCYPRRHRQLHDDILRTGAVITEFNPGTSPRPERFPMRNRIISGLSVGVLVVEASLQSGSLITARQALDQNREVFAVPHSIYDPGGPGCHQLIRDGAKLSETVEHLLEEVGSLCEAHTCRQEPAEPPAALAGVWRLLGYDPSSVDELVEAGAGPVEQVLASLSELELGGYVERHGGLYLRKL